MYPKKQEGKPCGAVGGYGYTTHPPAHSPGGIPLQIHQNGRNDFSLAHDVRTKLLSENKILKEPLSAAAFVAQAGCARRAGYSPL